MKKYLKFALLFAVSGAFAFTLIPLKRSMVGHWRVAFGDGIKGNVVFRSNGTYEATFDGQTWKVGGQYKLDGDLSTITDSSCGFGYWAKYKATWYTDDSLRMTVIEDSCTGRRADADNSVMVREKKTP
jgi:hypothetical protein